MTMRTRYFSAVRWAARLGAMGIAALLLWLPGDASAQTLRTCTGGGAHTLTLPARITVPRNAPIGTMLVAPVLGPQLLGLYQCTNATKKNSSGAARKSNLTGAGQTADIVVAGQTLNVPVYETGVPGIGIVVAVRNFDTDCGADSWFGVMNAPTAPIQGWQNSACNGSAPGDTANSGLQWAVGLVKTAAPVQPGVIAGIQVMQLALANNEIIQEGALSGSVNISSVNVVVLSCSTPNVTVPMGTNLATAFKGVGSTTNPVRFSVAINNCPAGMNRIGMQLVAPAGYIDQAGGVIKLGSDSTARGIGLKLTTQVPSGVAMTFGAPGYPVSGYSTQTAGSSFTMDFNAAYYQAAAVIGGGTANAVLEFTMSYQ